MSGFLSYDVRHVLVSHTERTIYRAELHTTGAGQQGVEVTLTEAEWADYRRVVEEYQQWQMRLSLRVDPPSNLPDF